MNTRTEHDKLQLHRIKKEIDKQIMSDPEKMKAFFEQIAKDIEPSLQHLSTIPGKPCCSYQIIDINFSQFFLCSKKLGGSTNGHKLTTLLHQCALFLHFHVPFMNL